MEKIGKINAAVFVSLLLMASLVSMANPVSALDTTTPISLATISQHNSGSDCWTALNGKVYNLTSYIAQHPGGSAMNVICGIDGTQIMSGQHPSSYEAIVGSLQIGILATPDTTNPVITLIGSSIVNLNVGDVYADAGATATDNVDGNLTSAIITVNPVNTSIAGGYTVTYTVADAAGNSAQALRTVIVSSVTPTPDTTAPVITILGSNPVSLNVGSNYTDAGATATDNVDGNLTSEIILVNSVNTSAVGNYTVTYNVTDAAGNSALVTRTVIVRASNNSEEDDEHHDGETHHEDEEEDDDEHDEEHHEKEDRHDKDKKNEDRKHDKENHHERDGDDDQKQERENDSHDDD